MMITQQDVCTFTVGNNELHIFISAKQLLYKQNYWHYINMCTQCVHVHNSFKWTEDRKTMLYHDYLTERIH
jgi:hypothetical protein